MACIDPQYINKIKALDLSNMSSAERIKALDDVMGSGGKDINLLYEKTLLLKNRARAFDKFVDDISGISSEKKAKIKEQIAKRLETKKETINNKELLGIVKDTLDRKYDLEIPDEAVEKMFKLRKEIDTLKPLADGTEWHSPERLAWGAKEREYFKIIETLKNPEKDMWNIIKDSLKESKLKISEQKTVAGKIGQTLEEIVTDIFTVPAKGIKAAWDASYLFRQGLKVLTADKTIWGKQAKGSLKSWTAVYDKKLMEQITDAFYADMVTHPLYEEALDAGLAVGGVEDFFPTNIGEKIWGIGNLFKASDDSFTMFSQGSRMELFDKYYKEFLNSNGGVKPDKEFTKSLANYVNGLTGRGSLGKAGEPASGFLNQIFFSARYQVANIKTFTDPLFAKSDVVKRIAQKNLAKHMGLIIGTMVTLSAFTDVGFDPRETTFGKVRLPGSKKWVDVTGGLASYFSLLAKMGAKVFGGPTKYGQDTAMDILVNFMKGKLAPVPGAARDILEQRTFAGKKPDLLSTFRSLFIPITADNVWSNIENEEDAKTIAIQAVLDIVGSGTSQPTSKREGTYGSLLDILK